MLNEVLERGGLIPLSFSVQAKNELARIEERFCCRVAELAALVRFNGEVTGIGVAHRRPVLNVSTENAAVARKVFKGLKETLELPARVSGRRKARLRKNNRYLVQVEDGMNLIPALPKLGLSVSAGEVKTGNYKRLLSRDCCRRSYLRGTFLARGSVSSPQSDYHLEILLDNETDALNIAELMQRQGLDARVSTRKRKWVVYIKDSNQIVDCLNLMGAHAALLDFENTRIFKEMRNQVNRLVNCDTANLNKTVRAGVRQEKLIRLLREHIGMHRLSPPLRQLAELRLAHPDVSLRELGELSNPPLSKSCVNHRLRKLELMARKLLSGENE
ncbi:MAG: DNA-binding protein WhiA [Eubacteriales bacterium]|nr:DNA-binding protein WhiA [Clostridia bacterium]MDZ4043370.1 DNA-binding protein WhiA [Eubacteriales bacterium]MDZ7609772.1 DNA-binding protein WhiA [Eubacteriales bacterium]